MQATEGPPQVPALCTAVDNRDILPPFFPSYRNEDGVHGLLVALCVRDSCVAHVPLVMQHLPEMERRNTADNIGRLRVCDLVMACCSLWSPGPGMATVDRIRALGAHLEALGGLPEREFKAVLMPPLYGRLAAILSQGENLLKAQNHQPEYWATALGEELDRYSSRAVEADYLVPWDLAPGLRPEAMPHIQRMVRAFGQILIWWPAIVRAARELASEGVTLGRVLD